MLTIEDFPKVKTKTLECFRNDFERVGHSFGPGSELDSLNRRKTETSTIFGHANELKNHNEDNGCGHCQELLESCFRLLSSDTEDQRTEKTLRAFFDSL